VVLCCHEKGPARGVRPNGQREEAAVGAHDLNLNKI
jgi:hypothetical protein